ncbi:MAG: hypothetical protein ABH869_02210 [Candidatus Omnitrophota bacterium]
MNKIIVAINTITVIIIALRADISPAQSIDAQKNEIRRLYNSSLVSYQDIQKKIEEERHVKHLQFIKKELEEFFFLAEKLEKLERYEQAAQCYEKILEISKKNSELQDYIDKKNKTLQEQAGKEQKKVSSKLKKKLGELKKTKKEQAYQLLRKIESELNRLKSKQGEQKIT